MKALQPHITPEYSEIFEDEVPTMEDLLKDVPSIRILKLLALMNAELYSHDLGIQTQANLFNLILARQSKEIRDNIIRKAQVKIKRVAPDFVDFFATLYNMEFIHYELTNYRDIPDVDLTVEQELNVFKAYLLIVQQINSKYRETLLQPNQYDEEYFGRITWPTLVDQWEINHRVNPFTVMLRGISLFNYLMYHSEHASCVDKFLQTYNKATGWNYALDIFNVLNTNYASVRDKPGGWSSFVVKKSPGFGNIFDAFSLKYTSYRKDYLSNKRNFSGIKSKPMIQLDDQTHLVLSWNFLCGKMYEGLVFDFYQHSGINSSFRTFPDFKKFIGEEVTEKFLFRKIMKSMFNATDAVLLFDDKNNDGLPDVYYREKNIVLLIEIKDAYFPVTAINSFSYGTITAEIDRKINNPKKGTGQLIKQLKRLPTQPFESTPGYANSQELFIYPIIVYTDMFFGMPGVNKYVNKCFQQRLKEEKLEKVYQQIHPVTLISLDFLLEHLDIIQTESASLAELINVYHRVLNEEREKFNLTQEVQAEFAANNPFEQVIFDHLVFPAERDYSGKIVDALDLNEGLPTGED